jgi:hypothetical protein
LKWRANIQTLQITCKKFEIATAPVLSTGGRDIDLFALGAVPLNDIYAQKLSVE